MKQASAQVSAWSPGPVPSVLRLRAEPEAIERLLRMPPLAFLAAEAPGEANELVYFDTARRQLLKSGLRLEVRRQGDGHVQRIEPFGGAAARSSVNCREDAVVGFVPRVQSLHELGGKFAKLSNGRLKPVFHARYERTEMILPARQGGDGGRIAVTIDRGVLEAGERSQLFGEIALSPVDGRPGDVFMLALALHGLEPLVLETRTLAERGYALAGARPPGRRKTDAVPLDSETTLDAGIGAVLDQCYGHWLANQAAAQDGRDTEGVHQMRVGLRRLRAALVFLGPWLGGGQAAWFEREVKWLAGKLGAVRDLDVLLADILEPVRRERRHDRSLKRLARVVGQRQVQAHARLVTAIASPRHTTLALTLGQWIAEHGWRAARQNCHNGPLTDAVRSSLDACHGAVLQAGRNFEDMDQEARHELRLDVKRLRYGVQFVGGAFGADLSRWLEVLGSLQDGLGVANDVALAEMLLEKATKGKRSGKERRELAGATGLVVGWWLAQSAGHEQALRNVWSEFLALAPFWRDERSRFEEGGKASS